MAATAAVAPQPLPSGKAWTDQDQSLQKSISAPIDAFGRTFTVAVPDHYQLTPHGRA